MQPQQPYSNPWTPNPWTPNPSVPRKRRFPKWVWIVVGGFGAVFVVCCLFCVGAIAWFIQVPKASPAAREPFNFSTIAVPAFPELGASQELEPGIVRYKIALGPTGGFYSTPGHGGVLWLYLPSGQHPAKSLPCILIAGAGSTMLTGMSLAEEDEDEHLPYVRAGCAVLAYELDGPESDDEDDVAMRKSYEAFRVSRAGLVNARNAIEFALARVPEIDPQRIYSAGHSSAATLSLLFAEHEPRLAGCIAYAPCYDVTKHLTPMGIRALSVFLPGVVDFAVQRSPMTHEARLNCPVFLFHAEDDSVCDIADSRACEQRLRAQGKTVQLEVVPSGGHYDSMIEQGIPKAIDWLKRNKGQAK